MAEYINSFVEFNLAAILFALIFGLIFLATFKYILWPILKTILNPIIDVTLSIIESFKSKKKQNQLINVEKREKISDQTKKHISPKFKFILVWFSKGFIFKTVCLIIIPFFIINYLLESKELGEKIYPINSIILNNTIGAIIGAIIVASVSSVLLKGLMNMKFSENIPLSFFTFLTIGIIHYFI